MVITRLHKRNLVGRKRPLEERRKNEDCVLPSSARGVHGDPTKGVNIPIHELIQNKKNSMNYKDKDDSQSIEPRRRKRKNDTQTMLFTMAKQSSMANKQQLKPLLWDQLNETSPSLSFIRCPLPYAETQLKDKTTHIFQELPESVIATCFFSGYLDTMEIVKTFSVISRQMSSISKETVHTLDLRKCQSLTPTDMQVLVRRYPNVTSLDVSYCCQFSDSHLMQLLPWNRTLTVLRLKGTQVTDQGISQYLQSDHSQQDPKKRVLQELDLSAITKKNSNLIGDSSVILLSNKCPSLRQLSLGWCTRISDVSIKSLINLQRLHTLDLSLTSITWKSCEYLSQMITAHHLTILDLGATHISGDRGVDLLIKGSPTKNKKETNKLETLTLRFVNDMTLKSIELLHHHCPKLKELDVTHCEGFNPSSLEEEKKNNNIWRCMKRKGVTVYKQLDSL